MEGLRGIVGWPEWHSESLGHSVSKVINTSGPNNIFYCSYFFFAISATQKGRSHLTVYTPNNINGICRFSYPLGSANF